jgi:NTP pyrophosphatase (non-canonical NTP hydrolase)
MHFADYQKLSTATAIYPGKGTIMGLAYVSLGANGEAGEIAEYVKKAWRDDNIETVDGENYYVGDERRRKILNEVGDTLWYLSQICEELDASLGQVAEANIQKLADRRERDAISGEGDDR